jgi:hypothetical protein
VLLLLLLWLELAVALVGLLLVTSKKRCKRNLFYLLVVKIWARWD